MDEVPEDLLAAGAAGGDIAAFEELARRHQQKVYRLVYAMTRNHSDADDLAQEVFLTAFRSIRTFNRKSSFYTWIYRIAVNRTLNFLKRKGRERNRAEFTENLVPAEGGVRSGNDPEAESEGREFRRLLEEAVESLPPRFKAAFLLVASRGMNHAEAAGVLGCSEKTVSWRMHKARKILRDRLHPFLTGSAP